MFKYKTILFAVAIVLNTVCTSYATLNIYVEPVYADAEAYSRINNPGWEGWVFDAPHSSTATGEGVDSAYAAATATISGHPLGEQQWHSWDCTVWSSISATTDGFASEVGWTDGPPDAYGIDAARGDGWNNLAGVIHIGFDDAHPEGTPLFIATHTVSYANMWPGDTTLKLVIDGQELGLFGDTCMVLAGTNVPFSFQRYSYLYEMAIGGPVDTTFEVVPEPATLGLLVLGGVAMLRRRK